MAEPQIQLPKPNWVRLEIEPVQVNPEPDSSLNFSTVQSVVPGAHGLYYRDAGERKALLFDTNTGRVYPPASGWDSVPIFIHLAHGSRHGTHFADYSKANDAFEKNISAVQKLFAAAGLGQGHKQAGVQKSTRARSTSKKGPKSGFEAQPENAHISEESDTTSQQAEEKARQIVKLNKKNAELRDRLRDCKSTLNKVYKRLSAYEEVPVELIKEEGSPQKSDAVKELTDKLQKVQQENEEKRAQDQTEKDEEINNLHSVIEDLRTRLAKSEQEKKENESKLGEHQEWLKNTKEKVNYLEGQLLSTESNAPQRRSRPPSESQDESGTANKGPIVRSFEIKLQLANSSIRSLESEKEKLQESNWYANERVSKLEQENGYLKGITEQLKARADNSASEKLLQESEKRVWELNDEKSKLEWRIGELTQWWSDAKWKTGEMEASAAHQRFLLDTANTKIQNLNDTSRTSRDQQLAQGFTIRQSNQGNWQLANGFGQNTCIAAPMTVPIMPSIAQYTIPTVLPQITADTRKVFLTIDNSSGDDVYVTGSFINWQCALRCETLPSGKKGVSVDLSRGRYEFRFMVNGQWVTSGDYQLVPNGLGGQNNLLFVD